VTPDASRHRPLRLALVGTGRMGAALAERARARGDLVVARLGRGEMQHLTLDALAGAHVVLEFTLPEAAPENLRRLAPLGVPVVTGTTGWEEARPAVEAAFREAGGLLLHASNFSVGVQLLLRAAREVARGLRGVEGFEGGVVEWHHREKVDAPSGTARSIRKALLEGDPDRPWPTTSLRRGWIPGTHRIEVEGAMESLVLEHVARDRYLFADGALLAAHWLHARHREGKRGVCTFADLFGGPHPASTPPTPRIP
jgi:4-hydroxy-tetrahydrodipicolinate reductase